MQLYSNFKKKKNQQNELNEKKKELIIAVAEDFTKDINQIQFHKNFNLNKIK